MTITVRVCATLTESRSALLDLFEWADELHLAYAWASKGDPGEHWEALPFPKITNAVIGTSFAQTQPAALWDLFRKSPGKLTVIEDKGPVFHPKVVVGLRKGRARALIGSSNLTIAGFLRNTEFNVVVEGPSGEPPLGTVLDFVERQLDHPYAKKPNISWLRAYERAYRRREPPVRAPIHAGTPEERGGLRGLGMGWDAYYSLIIKQEGRSVGGGQYRLRIFAEQDEDHGSYLAEAGRCQAAFGRYGSLRRMPPDVRKYVAGFGGGAGCFGRMWRATYFKRIVNRDPSQVSKILDAIPAHGPVSEVDVAAFFGAMRGVRGVGLGAATRLLIAKRPDVFFPVNRANRRSQKRVFGQVARDGSAYLRLLRHVWATPWFRSPEPRDETQARIWRIRAAILDAILYD